MREGLEVRLEITKLVFREMEPRGYRHRAADQGRTRHAGVRPKAFLLSQKCAPEKRAP